MKYKVTYMNQDGKLVYQIVDSKSQIDQTRVVVGVYRVTRDRKGWNVVG